MRLPILAMLLVMCAFIPATHGPAVQAAPVVKVALSRPLVHPGERQVVRVSNLQGQTATVHVIMPNGSTRDLAQPVVRSGVSEFAFRQPANVLSRTSRTARVSVLSTGAGTTLATASYRIAFAPIDVAIPGTAVRENSTVALWVHAGPRAPVFLGIHGSYYRDVMGTTGKGGWFRFLFQATNPTPNAITVEVSAQVPGTVLHTTARFIVQPFAFRYTIGSVQVLHMLNGAWTPTATVEAGEEFRVVGIGSVWEPAGYFVTAVPGTVSLHRGDGTVASQELQPVTPASDPYYNEYATFRLPASFAPGPLEVGVDIPSYFETDDHSIYRLSITRHTRAWYK